MTEVAYVTGGGSWAAHKILIHQCQIRETVTHHISGMDMLMEALAGYILYEYRATKTTAPQSAPPFAVHHTIAGSSLVVPTSASPASLDT